jgi:hypothetical protein
MSPSFPIVPSSESITSVLNILKAKAEFDGNSKKLHLRVAYDTKKDEVLVAPPPFAAPKSSSIMSLLLLYFICP